MSHVPFLLLGSFIHSLSGSYSSDTFNIIKFEVPNWASSSFSCSKETRISSAGCGSDISCFIKVKYEEKEY